MRDNITIGIIGFGNMGSAIAERLSVQYQIFVFDKDKDKTKDLSKITVADNVINLIGQAQVLILAVKPQDFDALLKDINVYVKGKLIISIAAGISTGYIEGILAGARVIRAMPNIGIKIGKSVTCLCKGLSASGEDLAFANGLFSYLGDTRKIPEAMMNAATAISGSGPAYIFDFIESESINPDNIPEEIKQNIMQRLSGAAKNLGFNSEDAKFLGMSSTTSTLEVMKVTGLSPSELKRQVTSKGGTTEAALEVLHKDGSWDEAAKAALRRAEELSKKE